MKLCINYYLEINKDKLEFKGCFDFSTSGVFAPKEDAIVMNLQIGFKISTSGKTSITLQALH